MRLAFVKPFDSREDCCDAGYRAPFPGQVPLPPGGGSSGVSGSSSGAPGSASGSGGSGGSGEEFYPDAFEPWISYSPCRDEVAFTFSVEPYKLYVVEIGVGLSATGDIVWARHSDLNISIGFGSKTFIFNNDYGGRTFRIVDTEHKIVRAAAVVDPAFLSPPGVSVTHLADVTSIRPMWSASDYPHALGTGSGGEFLVPDGDHYIVPRGRLEYHESDDGWDRMAQTVSLTGVSGSTSTWTRDLSDPLITTVARRLNGFDNHLAAEREDFRYLIKARSFKDGCQSPLTLILVDKRMAQRTRMAGRGRSAIIWGSCDLSRQITAYGYQRRGDNDVYTWGPILRGLAGFAHRDPNDATIGLDPLTVQDPVDTALGLDPSPPHSGENPGPPYSYSVTVGESGAACSLLYPDGGILKTLRNLVRTQVTDDSGFPILDDPFFFSVVAPERGAQLNSLSWNESFGFDALGWESHRAGAQGFHCWDFTWFRPNSWDAMPACYAFAYIKAHSAAEETPNDLTTFNAIYAASYIDPRKGLIAPLDEVAASVSSQLPYFSSDVENRRFTATGPNGGTRGLEVAARGWVQAKGSWEGFDANNVQPAYLGKFDLVLTAFDDFNSPSEILASGEQGIEPSPPASDTLPVHELSEDWEAYHDGDTADQTLDQGHGWSGDWVITSYESGRVSEDWEAYQDGDAVTQTLDRGEGWASNWVIEDNPRVSVSDDFESYSDAKDLTAVSVLGLLDGGTGWAGPWTIDSYITLCADDMEGYTDAADMLDDTFNSGSGWGTPWRVTDSVNLRVIENCESYSDTADAGLETLAGGVNWLSSWVLTSYS